MPTAVSVKLRYATKQLWFDPAAFGPQIQNGTHVVVTTANGTHIGMCAGAPFEVEEADLPAPLKPIDRVATAADFTRADEMARRSQEALPTFREAATRAQLPMKPVAVDFHLNGDKATFYFAADERVDFRSLVRELASIFHIRVDMRQIGARDEACMLGGIAHCGQEFCCKRMGGQYNPVSIRMAKEQDLPLNPVKISGACGRLMCCLRYEFEAYKDFKQRAPKKNAVISTPLGEARVVDFDTPREIIHLRLEDGSALQVPLGKMDCAGKEPVEGEPCRPCNVSQQALDEIREELERDSKLMAMTDRLFASDPALADTTAQRGSVRRTRREGDDEQTYGAHSKAKGGSTNVDLTEGEGRKRRSRRNRNAASHKPESMPAPVEETRKVRRRLRPSSQASAAEAAAPKPAEEARAPRRRLRPGQNSSGLANFKNEEAAPASAPKPAGKSAGKQQPAAKQQPSAKSAPAPEAAEQTEKRKPRRRGRRGGRGRNKNKQAE